MDDATLGAAYKSAWELAGAEQREGSRPARREELVRLVDALLAATAEVRPAPGEPPPPARARAFALAWDVPGRAYGAPDVATAEGLLARAREALALRSMPLTRAAVRAAEMGVAFASARADGAPERGYRHLFEWVAAHPLHSSYAVPDWVRDKPEECMGLEPFFDDAGFVAWARTLPRPETTPSYATAMLYAAGEDRKELAPSDVEPASFGRLGRILCLRALGAPLEARNKEGWSLLELAALASGSALVRALVELGLTLDGGDAPPLVAMAQWGSVAAVKALLEAGAAPDARSAALHPRLRGLTALGWAKKHKKPEMIALFPPPRAAKRKTGIDTSGAKAVWQRRRDELASASWFDGDAAAIDRAFQVLELDPPSSWAKTADVLESLDPSECLAMTLVLREAVPPAPEPVALSKKDATKPRVVIGDVELSEPLELSARWVITGSVRSRALYSDDETASLFVGGDIAAEVLATEGDLWVAGDLRVSTVALATYEAGSLVVAGALRAPVLVTVDHRVEASRIEAEHRLEGTSRGACGEVLVDAAFDGDELRVDRVWKLAKAGEPFLRT